MSKRSYNLPSVNALVTFEAVARLQGFARAAEELNTSQPAISRHIRNLEIRFGAELFDRSKTPICLTPKGHLFYSGVLQGLGALQGAVQELAQPDNQVTIVCSHSVSHLLLMPRYGSLRQALGAGASVRLMTAEYNLVRAAVDTGADITFEYADDTPPGDHVEVCREEIKPVGTSDVILQAQRALRGECEPPPLLRLKKENYGWMDWADWQAAHPAYANWPVSEEFDSYVYLLEAAVSGAGLGLGWRSFVDAYLERGDLAAMPDAWFSRNTRLYARLTRHGQRNPVARQCLGLLAGL